MDLRTYLETSHHVQSIERPAACAHAIPAILTALERVENHRATRFRNVLGEGGRRSEYDVLVNLFADERAIPTMLAEGDIPDISSFNQRVAKDGRLDVVEDAAIFERVSHGDDVDLNTIPVVTHHEKDAGPYFTAGIVIVKDRDTGVYNAAIQRLLVHDRKHLGIFMVPTGQNKKIHEAYCRAGEDMPIAVVVGHHPLFYFGVQTKEGPERDEYKIAAALMGGHLRMARSPQRPDFLIPADAELVITGTMPVHERRMEGPFGEYSHYYCERDERELIVVDSIMRRNDPIYLDIFACHRDHHLLEGTLMTAQLTSLLAARYPEFRRLSLPLSGCCQMYCYVAVAHNPDVDITRVGLEILDAQGYIKYVVFVDEDIDVDNEPEVLWAIATRTRLSERMTLTSSPGGTLMDPMAKVGTGPERGVIDATAKDRSLLKRRVRVDPKAAAAIDCDAYLAELKP